MDERTNGQLSNREPLYIADILYWMKKPLEPLIPLDDLKKVLAKIVAVPKDAIGKPEPERPKRKRQKKPTA